MKPISIQDFLKVDIRAGRVVRAEEFPRARKPAYKLWIDFGELGVKKSSARITDLYSPDGLVGSQVAAVVNFGPRQVADFISEVLVLGFVCPGGVVLVQPEHEVPPGTRLS
jgi:tRNA-binding protein